jgi:hypothetical protein
MSVMEQVQGAFTVDNRDENGVFWFEMVTAHPDPAFEAKANRWCREMALQLGFTAPCIHWMRQVDPKVSRLHDDHVCGRLANGQEPRTPKYPLDWEFGYFGLVDDGTPGRPGGCTFHGWTSDILVAVDLSDQEEVLAMISHECCHAFQNATRGGEWMSNNNEAAEMEARRFETTNRSAAKRFLED